LITELLFTKLVAVWCGDCRSITRISSNSRIQIFYNAGCPWLDHFDNKDFKSNEEKLISIQRNMKSLLKYKRFKRAVHSRAFTELWYHPNAGGGRRAKRRMLEGIDCV
jgi:hypothetical protein